MGYTVKDSIGKPVFVETPLPDGSMTGHLGEICEVSLTEICLKRVSWVKDTGRYHLFMKGEFDKNSEFETLPPASVVRLPYWGSKVSDWPGKLPTVSK